MFLVTVSGSVLAQARCDRKEFVLAIDIGHSSRDPGAISAHGVPEYLFNKRLANRLLDTAHHDGFKKTFIINNDGSRVLTLTQRSLLARRKHADLLLSIHHDSARAKLLNSWQYKGVSLRYADQFSGYSIFYSERNRDAEESRDFARILGSELRLRGLTPTLHHDGVGQRHLVDRELGVYRYDPLILLRTARMPAVLFEAGVILNRRDEADLSSSEHQDQEIGAILDSVSRFCANN